MSFGRQLYRALLGLYPTEFRREYEDSLAQTFEDMQRDHLPGFWRTVLGDLIVSAAREQYDHFTRRVLMNLQTMKDNTPLIKKASALIPMAMALSALALLIGHIAIYGIVREADEGTAARIFQLLMVAQVPFIAYFAIKWLPTRLKQALGVLVILAGIDVSAIATVIILESM